MGHIARQATRLCKLSVHVTPLGFFFFVGGFNSEENQFLVLITFLPSFIPSATFSPELVAVAMSVGVCPPLPPAEVGGVPESLSLKTEHRIEFEHEFSEGRNEIGNLLIQENPMKSNQGAGRQRL